jgi:hypothetical protein
MTNELSMDELLALPVTVDLETAGRAFGLGRSKAHELARQDEFPCQVLRLGNRYRVRRSELFAALRIDASTAGGDEPPALESPAPSADERTALRASFDEIVRCAATIIRRAEELRPGEEP